MNPADVQAAIEAFQFLEPQIQKGIAALIHHFKKAPLTPQAFIAQAQALLGPPPTPAVTGIPHP